MKVQRDPPPLVAAHLTYVLVNRLTSRLLYVARCCNCNWRSPYRTAEHLAEDDAVAHRYMVLLVPEALLVRRHGMVFLSPAGDATSVDTGLPETNGGRDARSGQ